MSREVSTGLEIAPADASIAAILLWCEERNYVVLQHRDDIPQIVWPSAVGLFGGAIEDSDSSPIMAAARELCEETSLRASESDLELICHQSQKWTDVNGESFTSDHYAFRYDISPSQVDGLEVYEGQGYITMRPDGKSFRDVMRRYGISSDNSYAINAFFNLRGGAY